jgi:hypothetical protein
MVVSIRPDAARMMRDRTHAPDGVANSCVLERPRWLLLLRTTPWAPALKKVYRRPA